MILIIFIILGNSYASENGISNFGKSRHILSTKGIYYSVETWHC